MRRLIRTDGTVLDLPDPVSQPQIEKLIGAAMLDFVVLRHLGEPLHVMAVDDLGYETEQVDLGVVNGVRHFENRCVKARKPVNREATKLYHLNCIAGTTHEIVGDVVVMPDGDSALGGSEPNEADA